MAKLGVYPGTFDPITNGHMDIIKRSLSVVDKLIVAVADDIPKTPIFSLEERTQMVSIDTAEFKDKIEVMSFKGLLMNFAEEQGADVIIRGLRAVSDFEYEFQMACMNAKLRPEIETVFLAASENTHFISSRFVKEIARLGGDIDFLVSHNVAQKIQKYYK